jgi:iron-sulfur cluster assembly protein
MTMEDATQAREATEDGIDIVLSDVAAREVRKFVEEESVGGDVAGLRVAVVPGGCSGFEYSLTLEDQVEEDDFVVESHGIKLFVDPFSAQYLAGTHIGYTTGFQGSGFTFDNPNASGGCGCGSSFAV